jgi:hypothetical protein
MMLTVVGIRYIPAGSVPAALPHNKNNHKNRILTRICQPVFSGSLIDEDLPKGWIWHVLYNVGIAHEPRDAHSDRMFSPLRDLDSAYCAGLV